jgi:hypothetical protein
VADDFNNNRVLIWNRMPASHFQTADVVLGQPNMTSNNPNNGGISGSSMSTPILGQGDGTHYIVCDYSNHRVLIWNSLPTQNGQSADIVLGQPDMTSNTSNNGGISARSLKNPTSSYVDQDGRLFVTDRGNSRVLVWNSFPTSNFQAADVVLGQPDFVTSGANTGGISAATLGLNPNSVYGNGAVWGVRHKYPAY